MELPKRELTELHTKYYLHPDIFDIFVEGDFDQDFINLFLSRSGIKTVSVFQVEDVDLETFDFEKFGLTKRSKKSQVIALAKIFDDNYGARPTNLTCLIDADRDRILRRPRSEHHVTLTDFTCLEAYFLNSCTLEQFMCFTCNLPQVLVSDFLSIASNVLPTQFALRASCEELEINKAVLDFETGLKEKNKYSSFSKEKYIENFISHNRLQSYRKVLLEKFDAVSMSLSSDLRHACQGHDFISLLFKYIWANNALRLHDKAESVLNMAAES